ncbi:MAG: TRIC cation channel family protein, partial [Sedimentisphaerales bacterium]|nr:TRIC cation channel family protein [Sedimentisphaerales bacterium]
MIYVLDIFGTFVFAVSGAFKAVRHELDILGVMVLAVATGVGGGIIRDITLGYTPPAVFQDEIYLLVCVAGGLVVFVAANKIAPRWDCVMFADAVGLSVFAAIGAAKAQ